MQCEKCNLISENDLVLCAQCGANLVEVLDENLSSVKTTREITRTEVPSLPAIIEKKPTIIEKTMQKAVNALASPAGRKVLKGAALVAVGVGLELATQLAARKPDQKLALPDKKARRNHLVAQVTRREEDGQEKVVQFFAPPSGTTVTETFYYKTVTVKRITKW